MFVTPTAAAPGATERTTALYVADQAMEAANHVRMATAQLATPTATPAIWQRAWEAMLEATYVLDDAARTQLDARGMNELRKAHDAAHAGAALLREAQTPDQAEAAGKHLATCLAALEHAADRLTDWAEGVPGDKKPVW